MIFVIPVLTSLGVLDNQSVTHKGCTPQLWNDFGDNIEYLHSPALDGIDHVPRGPHSRSARSVRSPRSANFFFLLDLTPRELISSIFRPKSKGRPPSFFDRGRTSGSVSGFERSPLNGTPAGTSTIVGDTRLSNDCTSSPSTSFHPNNNANSLEKAVEQGEQWKPGKKEWLIMVTLAISSLTVALDATILVPVLPTLAVSLDGTATEAFWAGTSYLLTSAVVQPFIAALSDIYGRRELLVPSLILFTISSIICGVAKSFTTLLVGRVIQGIGGGGIITLAQIIYGDIVPLRQRPRYFSLVLAAWVVGTLLGPVVGGCFVEKATWRWCFYLNLPICGLALPMAAFFVDLRAEDKTILEKVRLVDWIGGSVFISSLTAFLVAISSGGVDHAWSSWRTILPLTIGPAGILLSLAWERLYAKNPFLQRSLFPNVSAIATYLSALFQGFILFMALYYVSFYFTAAKLASPVDTGVKLLPAVCLVLPGSIIVSILITRLGCYRWAIWIGWAITTIGCSLLILLDEHTPSAVYSTALSVLGLGLGMILSSVNFATQASVVNDTDSGRAAAMYAFMRTLGMTLGVATGGTIFQNLMKQKLRELCLAEAIAENAEAFVEETLRNMPANDPLFINALKAYAHGFRGVFVCMTTIASFALVASLAIKHFSMDKILESKFSLQQSAEQSERTRPERLGTLDLDFTQYGLGVLYLDFTQYSSGTLDLDFSQCGLGALDFDFTQCKDSGPRST